MRSFAMDATHANVTLFFRMCDKWNVTLFLNCICIKPLFLFCTCFLRRTGSEFTADNLTAITADPSVSVFVFEFGSFDYLTI
jgi:hypothetical protein